MRPPRTSSVTVSCAARRSSDPHSSCTVASRRRRASSAGRVGALVEFAQHPEHAGELVDRGTSARLGRMGGHHQPQLGTVEHLAQLLLGGAGPAQVGHHLPQRPGARAVRVGGVPGAQPPHPLVVLGQVDELEPPGQRPHQKLGLVEGEARHQLGKPVGGALVPEACLAAESDRVVEQPQDPSAAHPVADRDHLAQHIDEERLVGGEVAVVGRSGSPP